VGIVAALLESREISPVGRWLLPLVIVACVAALVLACFGSVLFRGEQYGYRDAAHYYYPLYQRVQAEWHAGRWPLWEAEENSGMPLLGNPTAAVLYPGKLIYALLPYAWAARLYVVAHTLLALAGMYVLLRSWQTSPTGAALAALGYAFGLPILFQYCNVIFLVGAAWLPLGFHAVDGWLRRGRRWALLELALVLAMQTLGGDPEAAYVLGVCAGGYALGLAWTGPGTRPSKKGKDSPPKRTWSWSKWWVVVQVLVGLAVVWIVGTLLLAAWLPRFRPPRSADRPALALPWMAWVPTGVASAWGLLALFFLARWRRGWESRLRIMLVGLVGAAALAAGLAAAQLLPVLEFTAQSGRAAGEGPHDIFPFSLEPIRLVEFLWPNVFGTYFKGNRSWVSLTPPLPHHSEVWVPSLYVGGLTLWLAMGGLGFRGGPPWRGWLSAVTLVTLVASLGEFTGPLWWARLFPTCAAHVGPQDPLGTTIIRLDGYLRDGDGSFYWFLATILPGFRQFRFSSKLLSFTVLGLAGLAGLGWDRLLASPGRHRRLARVAIGLLAVSLLALLAALLSRDGFVRALRFSEEQGGRSPFGSVDYRGAYLELCQGLAQASVVLMIGLFLVYRGARAPRLACVVAVLVTTADLALANARYIFTVPQALFDTTPKVVRLIEEAERRDPAPGPYRVHRMPIWDPLYWALVPSADRVRDYVSWERESIQPKYGLPYGINYTLTLGVAELYDYEWFFGGFHRTLDASAARALHAREGLKVVVYPRRSFDLWNTRYFVLPVFPNGWTEEHRGYAAFLPFTEPVYPDVRAFQGPGGPERQKAWAEREDYQILRNQNAFPRAWIVHAARFIEPIKGLERTARDKPMEEILYANDYLWHDPSRPVYDPRLLAWIDDDQRTALLPYLPGMPPGPRETVEVTTQEPQRVVLDVVLEHPGLVVLADIYYPGWQLTIDGANADIYRANRLMRGAAVKSGPHRLVYTYAPPSFALGGWITLAALGILVALAIAFTRRPISAGLLPPRTGVLE
jgi:hypothetical protein